MGFKEWLISKRKKGETGLPEIPEKFLHEVDDGVVFDYFCLGCGHQTSDFKKKCIKCGGTYRKTVQPKKKKGG